MTYAGVGKGGPGTEHLGECTQIAVFVKVQSDDNSSTSEEEERESFVPYKLVNTVCIYIQCYIKYCTLNFFNVCR